MAQGKNCFASGISILMVKLNCYAMDQAETDTFLIPTLPKSQGQHTGLSRYTAWISVHVELLISMGIAKRI